MFKGRICVPKNEVLRNEILEEAHSTPIHCTSRWAKNVSRSSRYVLVEEYEKEHMTICGKVHRLPTS